MNFKYSKANPLARTLTKSDFVRLYVSQKKTMIEIAGLYGVSQDAVFRLRRAYGIRPRQNQKRLSIPIIRGKPMECYCTPEEIRSLYWDGQLSMEDIGHRFGVTRKAVSYYFKKHALPARSSCAARRLATKQGKLAQKVHSISSEYFQQWSPEMAWTLGVLFVRGLVTVDNKNSRKMLTIIEKDVDLLMLLKTNLGSSHPLIQQRPVSSEETVSYRYEIANVVLVEDLIKMGITQERAQRRLNADVPREFHSDFVRGIFEGGGEITIVKLDNQSAGAGSESLVFAIRHRSEPLLNQVREILASSGLETPVFVMTERNMALRSLEYYDADCHKLLSFIYGGSASLCSWHRRRREVEVRVSEFAMRTGIRVSTGA